jgi:16S rRNA (cytidine1402-2'-O)-methyltransferase
MSEEIVRGALYVVSTPIGNLGDISTRAAAILGGVDLIAAEDTRTTRVLLDHLGITKQMVSFYSYNEQRRTPELIKRLREGEAIALVTDAGTPGVSDPAYVLVREAIDAGARVIPVPGASALLAALVASGLPMDRFVFEGFLPLKKGRKTRIAKIAEEEKTVILYESPHRVAKTLRELAVGLGVRRVAVARELTKKFETIFRGTLAEAADRFAEKDPRGEFVLVIEGSSRHAFPVTGKELDTHGKDDEPDDVEAE